MSLQPAGCSTGKNQRIFQQEEPPKTPGDFRHAMWPKRGPDCHSQMSWRFSQRSIRMGLSTRDFWVLMRWMTIPSGKLTPFLMEKSTINGHFQ